MPLAALELSQLVKVIWVSLVAGIGETALFSLVVFGGARSLDARRSGRDAAASVYAGAATVAFLVFAAVVVIGVKIMLSK